MLSLFPFLPFVVLAAGLVVSRDASFGQVAATGLALGASLQLYPAADLPHALMTLPPFVPVLAGVVARLRTAGTSVVLALAILIALFAAPLLRIRVGAQRADGAGFTRASGVRDGGSEFSHAVSLVRWLANQPPGPILVLANQQLLYFLSGRRSLVEHDEFVLYLVGADLIEAHAARRWIDEDAIVTRLRETGALVVDSEATPAGRRVLAVFPRVAALIDDEWREVVRFGGYRVLAPAPRTPDGQRGSRGYPRFSSCPPNSKRIAERSRSAKSAWPRELKRS